MKRSTKILIASTVVASVVSVGAVSYAFWTAGDTQSQEVTGTAGTINTVGELTVTPSTASGASLTSMNALYPVDQGSAYRTYWEFDVTVTGELTKTVAETGAAALFYSATAPSGAPVSGAKQISGTDAEGQPITAQEITLAESGATKVYIYMTANGTDAMKANIKLTFEATAAAE